MVFKIIVFSIFILFCTQITLGYELNILHYNDFHARFVETSRLGTPCNQTADTCIGGFARLATLVRQRLVSEPDSLLLNAGDSFQGTIWYNILRWNVTQDFMNMLPHDAHYFMLEIISYITFTRATLVRQRLVSEPDSLLLNAGDSFQGTIWYNILRWNVTQDFMNMLPHDAHVLGNHEFDNGIEGVVPYLKHLNSTVVTANIIDDLEPTIQGLYEKSIIIERNNRKIGIIGVLIATTDILASTGRLKFKNEIEAVREEAEKLNAQGVDIIVVLSHCGLDIDREIALHAGPQIDIIVGGHSHTLLFNGEAPENSGFIPLGPYPVVVEQGNRKVLIVQAAAHTQYLGEIKLTFDDNGHLTHWAGNPHYIGNEIEQGMALSRAGPNQWNYAHFCVNNRGVIRAAIDSGVITYEGMIVASPFENNVEVFDLKGEHVMAMLEFSVENVQWPGARLLQVSGLRVTFDGSRPVNSRVVDVQVRCIECDVPKYEPLKLDQYYKVVSQSFIANGGDGYSMISDNRKNIEVLGVDYDILSSYVGHQSPVFAENEGRLIFNNFCQPES
ncbi:apyrase-like [Spodoptera litura]|uniref:apyrase n=1 Tax=Spodoptera litura TaxID=69820 RepID=A0A9J7DUC8_SPOLT|nr:apyrase-like [Spodoptera litura]